AMSPIKIAMMASSDGLASGHSLMMARVSMLARAIAGAGREILLYFRRLPQDAVPQVQFPAKTGGKRDGRPALQDRALHRPDDEQRQQRKGQRDVLAGVDDARNQKADDEQDRRGEEDRCLR